MKKLFLNIYSFFKVSWVNTIILNFTKLPFKHALKIPLLLYRAKVNFRGGGRILIDASDISFGMIKLGIKHESGVISKGFCLDNRGLITFMGAGVMGNGSVVAVKEGAHVVFGRNFGITGDFVLHCHKSIVLGDNFSCSWNVSVCDTDFHQYLNARTGEVLPVAKKIIIGNNVWLCQRVLVLKGTVIPDWCVVAAMSLLNKEYCCPNFSVIAGSPGRVLDRQIQRYDIAAINSCKKWMITSGLHLFNDLPRN